MELIGPMKTMKLRMLLMFHLRGLARYSSSTLSRGMPTCETS